MHYWLHSFTHCLNPDVQKTVTHLGFKEDPTIRAFTETEENK